LETDTRGKLVENIESLEKMDGQLTGVTKIAHETAGTTNTIISNLRRQRDVIINSTKDVVDANKQVNMSKKIINEMTRIECCYKTMLYIVIIVLFAVILTLGIVLIHKKSK
jgi:hypothetical protein